MSAFALDRRTGALRALGAQSSRGKGPCHLSVDASGRCVLVANYGSGSVAVLAILSDGRLAGASDFVQHPAPAVRGQGQEVPHAHSVTVDRANAFAYVADLGLDRIMLYALDASAGRLRPASPPWVALHPGAGPRHFAFHPSDRFAYVINELDNTICSYRCRAPGSLEYVQRVSTLPEGWKGQSWCADIHVSPDGRFVYGSNRGHHSIAVFAVDQDQGTLSPAGHEPTRGEWPRSFALDPTGRFVIVANEHSDSVVGFAADPRTGRLEPTGQLLSVPAPVCVKVLAPLA